MPLYSYISPIDNHIVTVFQTMKEKHEYKEGDVVFNRVWEVPCANSDSIIDPHSKSEFISKLANKKGETIGTTMDRAAELSARRAAKEGKDPIKEKYYNDFTNRHKGKVHPQQAKENCAPIVDKLAKLGVKVKL